MTVNGTIYKIMDTVVVSEKFQKREFVVEDNSMYPQKVLIQMTQDKCSLLDKFKVNQEVTVSINLRGREWTSPQGEVKYFNTIEGWRIEEGTGTEQPTKTDSEEEDLLPF